jgi:hypothetical protein
MLLPRLFSLIESAPVQELIVHADNFFKALLVADADALTKIQNAVFSENGVLYSIGVLVSQEALGIILALVGCVVAYVLKRYGETFCYVTLGDALDDKMATYANTPFLTGYVSNLGRASVYGLVYVPVSLLFDLVSIGGMVAILFLFELLAALFLSVTLIVAVQALKLTITVCWMPAMTTDKKNLRAALKWDKDVLGKKNFWRIYSNYIAVVYLIIIINVLAAFTTFGSALILSIPASSMFLLCQQYTAYYTVKGKKYFITYEKIESNSSRGEKENFFEYMSETAENDGGLKTK